MTMRMMSTTAAGLVTGRNFAWKKCTHLAASASLMVSYPAIYAALQTSSVSDHPISQDKRHERGKGRGFFSASSSVVVKVRAFFSAPS